MSVEDVLVCGGAGYIGSSLVFRLLKETQFRITVFDNLMYSGDSLFSFFNYGDRFSFVKGDLRYYDFDKLLEGKQYVINLAALVGEPICKKYPYDAQQINFESNIRLAKEAEKKRIKRFIFTSTCSNYGLQNSDTAISEDGSLQPLSIYAKTKVDSENILLNNLQELPTTILRFATAYGMATRIRFDLLLHELIRDAWTRAKIYVYGAQSWRPIVHVDDIARSIIAILTNNQKLKNKDIYNIGSNDQNFQKLTLAEMVAHRFDVPIEVTATVKDPRNYKVSFDKVKKELNFEPIHRPKETIDQIAQALETNLLNEKHLQESVNVKIIGS
ncbi:MAG: NAD-dependent epimerase/dehydratase family protein [Nitrososphaerota archaeon]